MYDSYFQYSFSNSAMLILFILMMVFGPHHGGQRLRITEFTQGVGFRYTGGTSLERKRLKFFSILCPLLFFGSGGFASTRFTTSPPYTLMPKPLPLFPLHPSRFTAPSSASQGNEQSLSVLCLLSSFPPSLPELPLSSSSLERSFKIFFFFLSIFFRFFFALLLPQVSLWIVLYLP